VGVVLELGPVVFAVVVELRSSLFGFLLGVIPGTTSVGGRDSNLDTGDDGTSEDTLNSSGAKENTTNDGDEDDHKSGGNHVVKGSISGDLNALSIVRLGVLVSSRFLSVDSSHVSNDEVHHILSSVTDSDHSHGAEGIGEHGTNKEARELDGLEDIDGSSLNTGDESTEEGKTDEASGTNGETFANSGSGVTSGIKSISSISDRSRAFAHLSNTTGIVRDRSVTINGKGNGKSTKHTEGSKSNTVHASNSEAEGNSGGNEDDGDDAGLITEGKTSDDVGSGTGSAGLVELEGGGVGVGSVVLSDETNEHAGPETAHDTSVSLPAGSSDGRNHDILSEEFELRGEDPEDERHEEASHEDGGDQKLHLEDSLNGVDGHSEEVDANNGEE